MMNQLQFKDWILTYFSLGLNCSLSILEAVFLIPRNDKWTSQWTRLLLKYFYDEMVYAMTKQDDKGWIRGWCGFSARPKWTREGNAITYLGSRGRDFEIDTFLIETADIIFQAQSMCLIQSDGMEINCLYAKQMERKVIKQHLPIWGAHVLIQSTIATFCECLEDSIESIRLS
jgi:hypothetical protein